MNKKTIPFLLLAVLFTIVYTSCKKPNKVNAVAENQAYFPLEKGKYVIYNVDSTIYDDTNCVTITRHSQAMYTVVDTFTDKQGRPSMRIDIRTRKKAEDQWEYSTVIYATNSGQELEVAQSGFRFIKMIYPVAEGRTWEGNANINTNDTTLAFFRNWVYRYTDVGLPFGNGDVTYNNTVSVIAIDEAVNDPETQLNSLASRIYGKEVFAPNIGMVYREYYRWTYDPAYANMQPNNINHRCVHGDGVIMRAVDHN